MADRKIVVRLLLPPIPYRTHDYCAFFDGDEEDSQCGYGATEAEAVADLLRETDDG